MMGTDFVYVWINSGDFATDDLKYSLRSVETNWLGRLRVTIVGDKHPGLADVWHVPHTRTAEAHLPKALDSVRKMEAIIQTGYIQEGFVYMYDDVYLLKPMDELFIRKRYAMCEMSGDLDAMISGRHHARQLVATVQALRDHGFKRIWNYETHLPRWFEKRKMQEVIDTYRPAGNRLLLATLYYNHHFRHQEPQLLHELDDVKVAFTSNRFGAHSIAPAPTADPMAMIEHYRKHTVGKAFWNHNNGGIRQVGLQYLRHSLFPNASEYEIKTPQLTVAR